MCDEAFWDGIRPRLSELGLVTVFSFAGFSSIEAMAEHVLASIPGRLVVVGHSMGGRVALELFSRAPARVRALALLNTGTHKRADHELASRARLVALAKSTGMTALAESWLPAMLNAENSTDPAILRQLTAMVERATPASFEGQVNALLNRPDATAVLERVDVPTMLLSATGDRWSPVTQHEEMRRHVPHARLVVISDAGHMAPIEQPQVVAAALEGWLMGLGDEDLDEAQTLAIESKCIGQIYRYARLNDAGEFASVANLFAEDGVFARPSEPASRFRGRAAILASLEARTPRITRHVIAGVEVTVQSSSRVKAHSTVLLLTGDGTTKPAPLAATAVGTFADVMEKVGADWLFVQRLGSIDIKG
jgi:pimeloyl-ACP methyl ester carboxylesterase